MKRRKNGEGSWGTKTIGGVKYKYFRDSKGKYYYGKTDKEVQEKVEKQRVIYNVASSVSDINAKPSTTLYKYAISYVESIKMTLQPYTYYNYTHMINNYLKNSKLGHKQLGQLTPDMISAFYSELTAKYSYGTISSINRILKGPLNAAEQEGLIKQYTVKKIRLPKERYCKQLEELHIPTIHDMERIKELCLKKTKHSDRYDLGTNGLFYVVCMYTGLRIGEQIALHWKDVDMDKRTINVNKSASFRVIDGKQNYEEKEPKSKSGYRIIPFNDIVYSIFTYLKEQRSNLSPEDFVFVNKNNKHMTKSSLEQYFNIHVRDALGIQRMTPHTLRHAYGSYLASKKVNPKVIAKLMGHSRIDITYDVYVEGYEDEMIEAANLFV